ncbi:hypothetical protein ACLKA7_008493 [Drosophila subpalustris]
MSEQMAKEMEKETAELDKEILRKVADSCSVHKKKSYRRLRHRSLDDMGYVFDECLKCNLVCDQQLLEKGLIEIVGSRRYTDIQVDVKGHIFNCHMAVLQFSTEYFKRFHTLDPVVIDSEDVTIVGFEKAYAWMTKVNATPQRENIAELYMTAKHLEMSELLKQLWFYFEDRTQFNEGQAFKLFLETVSYQALTLQHFLLTRISYFFLSAITTLEYLQLNANQVHDMLDSNVAGVNNEYEILMCALRWLMCDWRQRKRHVHLLMSAVRFGLMPPWYLLSLRAKQTMPELQEICDDPTVLDMINDGLSHSVTHESLNEMTMQLHQGPQREWIIDEQAPHHHEYKCPNWQGLDYEKFSGYVDRVINAGPLFYKSLKPKTAINLMPCCRAKF